MKSGDEGLPEGGVAALRPDARARASKFVVHALHVEGQAVFEDGPLAKTRGERAFGGSIRPGNARFVADGLAHGITQDGEICLRLVDGATNIRSLHSGAASGDNAARAQSAHVLQRANPVLNVGIATVRRGAGLYKVSGEEDAFGWQPDCRIAFGMGATEPE